MILDHVGDDQYSFVNFPTRETINQNPLQPVSVLSRHGLASYKNICDPISAGFYYVGIPLDERCEFDGNITGPLSFVRHDLFHGDFTISNSRSFKKTLKFLRKLNSLLEKKRTTPLEQELTDFIQFIAIHEMGKTKLFTLISEGSKKKHGKKLGFQEFAEILLNLAIKYRPDLDNQTTSRPFNTAIHDIYVGFLEYGKKKKFLSFPEGLSFTEELNELDNQICNHVDSLITIINTTERAEFSK